MGRVRVYEALVKGKPIPTPGVPESFRVLIKEFQALGLDIQIVNKDGSLKDVKELEDDEDKEDTPVSIEEISKVEDTESDNTDESDYEDVQDEDDEDLEDMEPSDDDLEYEEEYGLDDYQEDAYERGEE